MIALQDKNFPTAENYFRETLALQPNDARAAVNLAGLLLLQDRAEEGWAYTKDVYTRKTQSLPSRTSFHAGKVTTPRFADLGTRTGTGRHLSIHPLRQTITNAGVALSFPRAAETAWTDQNSGLVSSCHTPKNLYPATLRRITHEPCPIIGSFGTAAAHLASHTSMWISSYKPLAISTGPTP